MAKRKMTATQKLRRLVQQQVRRMEKRGYRVEPEVKEKIKTGKYQTLKSIQKSKYQKLYRSSSSEVDGKIVSGEQKRIIERSESARKAAETRRQRRRLQQSIERDARDWERRRREQDERDRRDAESYDEGRIAYSQINELIEQYPTPGSRMLSNALRSEIGKYGERSVLQAMGQAPETFIAMAQQIIYYEEESSAIHSALVSFIEIITGTILNTEESKEIGETLDEMTDMGEL